MKVRITDLLDSYSDDSVRLASLNGQRSDLNPEEEIMEVHEVKQTIKKKGAAWKGVLAVAAAAAVLSLGIFGVSKLLNRKGSAQATDNPNPSPAGIVTEPAQPHTTDPVTADDRDLVELTPELQHRANRFLTIFAEQGITEYDLQSVEPYQLARFAHLYYKINEPDSIVYQALDDQPYETITREQVDSLLATLLDLRDVVWNEGDDFTAQSGDNYAVHERYLNDTFWFPAADGDSHSSFAVCERIKDNKDGTWSLEYRVYDFMDPTFLTPEQKGALADMTIQKAEQDDSYILVMCGCAVVRLNEDEMYGWCLHDLNASLVEDPHQIADPDEPTEDPDPENLLQDPTMRAAFNSLLSIFAAQDVTSRRELVEDDGALMQFAHQVLLLYKYPYDDTPVDRRTRDGVEYDVIKLTYINDILNNTIGVTVEPTEGVSYTVPLLSDRDAVAFLQGDEVWFTAGEGKAYPCFVVCTKAQTIAANPDLGSPEQIYVEFRIYETTLEDFESGNIREYYQLTAEEAEAMAADHVFYLGAKGSAVILPVGSGLIAEYERTWIEPEGWEEEWPQEYPVNEYRIEGDGFLQSGEVNLYRYEQLPEAEHYVEILTGFARDALGVSDASFEMDSPHDGYANWFMTTSKGSASVSGSSITGRFTYNLYPGFDRVLEQSTTTELKQDPMEQAAWAFVEQFEGITGPLELIDVKEEETFYHDERFVLSVRDITVPSLTFYFRSAENSRVSLAAQDGLELPVTCGDSTIEDLGTHVFAVTVWPDGTVVSANNYITKAQISSAGSMRVPDESAMENILSFMTSYTENDTFVLESASVDTYSVYFGYAVIDPVITIRYHFASDPDNHQSTDICMPGILD